jgi:hypothetical protein
MRIQKKESEKPMVKKETTKKLPEHAAVAKQKSSRPIENETKNKDQRGGCYDTKIYKVDIFFC